MRDHVRQQRVARNVEWHAQPNICGSLVHLAGQLTVGHVKLHQTVAGRKGHNGNIHRVPGAQDDPPIGGIVLQLVDDFRQLIFTLARVIIVARAVRGSKVAPLEPINWTQVPCVMI